MSGFDTSGYVPEHGNEAMVTLWSDLNPFTQGYVEALLAGLSLEHHSRAALKVGDKVRVHTEEVGTVVRLIPGKLKCIQVRFSDGGGQYFPFECVDAPLGFSDLAPETLARIMEDCERFQATDAWRAMLVRGFMSPEAMPRDAGRALWNTRNGGAVEPNFWDDYWTDYSGGTDLAESVATFPPLTPYLGDDGKVYLRDASPSSDRGGS